MSEVFNNAKSIIAKLVKSGYIAYFAGGWVRDYVMGHPSEDIDIATNASPAEVMDLFPQTILVGLAFGVVIVLVNGHQYEVATFRKDLRYIDGRHPVGIEMSTPREDALRRDFTINGMFYDPLEETIHDFVQGQEDIHLGIIRTIGDPHERFFEDRLRMLRAFRFSSRFGFAIEQETQEAIRENAGKLFPAVAMERVWQEFNKMVSYPRFDQAVIEMHRLALLDEIFPEMSSIHIKDLRRYVQNYVHFPTRTPTILYLMEFLQFLPIEERAKITERIKATKKDLKLLEYFEWLLQSILEEEKSSIIDLPLWANLMAHPDYELSMQIIAGRLGQNHFMREYTERYKLLETHIQRIKSGKPLISGSLLYEYGIKQGKAMGLLLKEAERIAIVENITEPDKIIEKLSTSPLWHEQL